MSDERAFVIQVTSAHGEATMWLAVSVAGAPRVFGLREAANAFATQSRAHAVIGKLPLAFDRAGFVFSVEADE
jgi:hypothetical protein